MTPCPNRAVLEALLADQLSAPIEATLEEHISRCSTCQQELETMTAETLLGRSGSTATDQEGFLASAALLPEPAVLSFPTLPTADAALPSLPGYEVIAEVGRGGMGIVYRARQVRLNRVVALKMLRAGGQANVADRARFQAEAEAVARLHHPNIVQIYDTGLAADQPYFALEFVEGPTLADRIDGTPQAPRWAAELVETLARAMHAAHERGILHRDLKPRNVLLASGGHKPPVIAPLVGASTGGLCPPLAGSTPKITDFGLAKFLDQHSDLTHSRDILGTPSYMAPEQARGGSAALSPASDIYSLGAILYELLTGRPPFRAETPYDTVLQVVQQEPVPPTQLQGKVPRDLETICLKCLQKEPGQRYPTALALADDLRRFLNNEPILARPISLGRRTLKWARRRPVLAGLLAAVVFLMVVALASLSAAVVQARKAERFEAVAREQEVGLRRAADLERQRAERLSARTLLDLGTSQCDRGDFDHGFHQFVRALTLATQLPDPDLEYAARANLACWRPYYLRAWGKLEHEDWVWAVAFSPDGKRVATGGSDRKARVWDALTAQPITPPLVHAAPVWAVAFSPDGRTLLTGSGNDDAGEAHLWDAATGKAVGTPLPHRNAVGTVAFTAQGDRFLTMCSTSVQVWDAAGRQPIGKPIRHGGPIVTALFSPDGKTVLTGSEDKTVELWRSDTGESQGVVLRHPGPVLTAAFSPNGQLVLTGCRIDPFGDNPGRPIMGAGRLWRIDTGEALGPPLNHQGPVKAVAFSPDGRIALTGGIVSGTVANRTPRGEARQWRAEPDDLKVGEQIGPIMEHPGPVWSVATSPTGQSILTGSEDRRARLWASATGQLIATTPIGEGTVRQLAYAPDGRTILTGSAGWHGAGRLWEAPPELGQVVLHGQIGDLQAWDLTRDGRFAVTGGMKGRAEVWDALTGQPLGQPLQHAHGVCAAAFTADGRTVVIGTDAPGERGLLHFWDRATGKQAREPLAHESVIRAIASSPDGRTLLTGTESGQVRAWDAATLQLRYTVEHAKTILTIQFSPDGQTFVSTSKDGTARLWETATGKALQTWPHEDWVKSGGFTPDGRLCLTASGRAALLWDVATGKPISAPRLHPAAVHASAIHPDGRSYFIGTWEGAFQRWDIALGKPLGPAWQLKQAVSVIVAGANSRVLIGGFRSQTATLCAAPAALAGDLAHVKLTVQVLTGMEMDDDGTTRELPPAEWLARRRELAKRGPNPFPVSGAAEQK